LEEDDDDDSDDDEELGINGEGNLEICFV